MWWNVEYPQVLRDKVEEIIDEHLSGKAQAEG